MSDPVVDPRLLRGLVAMAIGRRAEVDDLTQQVYLAGLKDLDVTLVLRACERLARTPRAPFESALPTLGQVRQTAAEIGREDRIVADKAKLLQAPAGADDDPRTWVCCRDCEDTGWRSARCGGAGVARSEHDAARHPEVPPLFCGRPRPHVAHGWAYPCPCVPTNPVIARRRDSHTSAA